jgi:hypothetical protein
MPSPLPFSIGSPVLSLRRYWDVNRPGEPCGPYWELTFRNARLDLLALLAERTATRPGHPVLGLDPLAVRARVVVVVDVAVLRRVLRAVRVERRRVGHGELLATRGPSATVARQGTAKGHVKVGAAPDGKLSPAVCRLGCAARRCLGGRPPARQSDSEDGPNFPPDRPVEPRDGLDGYGAGRTRERRSRCSRGASNSSSGTRGVVARG